MPFIPHTEKDVRDMLKVLNVNHIETLFDEIPDSLRQADLSSVPKSLTEMELNRLMRERAAKDADLKCFIGAGAYEHHIPAAVWEVASRGEYMTAYTPYQAEASQGTLQLLYEYQTMMASLMGLSVSNASLYDGASALAEAVLMAVRLNRKKEPARILLPTSIHPFYRQVVKTIVTQQGILLEDVPFDKKTGRLTLEILQQHEKSSPTALVIPQPNFFGVLEEVDALTQWIHHQGGLAIAVVNPLAMAWLKPPGQWGENGVDIACGEGQPLGVPLASGGPYYGFLCCKKEWVRQLPGRIVGKTVDASGKVGFVLTLQAREQHIRRAKATSNICTNQGLLVTASTIFMSLLGPLGLRKVAMACHQNTVLLKTKLQKLTDVAIVFEGPFFHEMVLRLPVSVKEVVKQLAKQRIQVGFSLTEHYPALGECLLLCVTETKTPEDLDDLVAHLKSAIQAVSLEKKSKAATCFA